MPKHTLSFYSAVQHVLKHMGHILAKTYPIATAMTMRQLWHTCRMLLIFGKSTSINVRKVLWTCAELGLPYQLQQYGGSHLPTNTPEFLAMNPNGLVPVIVDDGQALWESNTICRYLAGKHGRPDLLPAEPLARAQVEKWMDWQATELNGAWRYAYMALVRQSPAHTDPSA
jgi:glutathione S-transferase